MSDCIFCKIASGEVQASKVYEDEHVLAFLDNRPTAPGHTLVILKQHFDRFDTMPEPAVQQLFAGVRRVLPGVVTGSGAAGCNVTVNVGSAAGQIVFHTHVHLIPRFPKDNLVPWHGHEYESSAQAEQVAQKIRAALKT